MEIMSLSPTVIECSMGYWVVSSSTKWRAVRAPQITWGKPEIRSVTPLSKKDRIWVKRGTGQKLNLWSGQIFFCKAPSLCNQSPPRSMMRSLRQTPLQQWLCQIQIFGVKSGKPRGSDCATFNPPLPHLNDGCATATKQGTVPRAQKFGSGTVISLRFHGYQPWLYLFTPIHPPVLRTMIRRKEALSYSFNDFRQW